MHGPAPRTPSLRTLAIAAAVFAVPACLGQAEPAPQQPASQQPAPQQADLPEVSSKEDFLALDRHERQRFSRAKRPAVSFFVDGGGTYSAPADLEDAAGEVDVWRLRGGGGLSFRLSDTADLVLRGGAEFSFYSFDGSAGVIPSAPTIEEPFDDVYELRVAPLLRVTPDEGWRWFVGGSLTSSGEPDADFADTLAGGGLAGASFEITDTFRLGAALSVTTRLEGGVFVLPIPIIEWDITDRLALRTRERGVGLEYWFTDSWNAAALVGFDRREFRLADDNAALPGGSVTDRRIPLTLAVTYSPSQKMIITARAGVELAGRLEFHDMNDRQVRETDLSENFVAGIDARFAF